MGQWEQVEAELPNRFHDAFLCNISVDYVARTAELVFEVWVAEGITDTRDTREAYRQGSLSLTGLLFLTVDVPEQDVLPDRSTGLRVDLLPVDNSVFARPQWPVDSLPAGVSVRSFMFTNEWNSGVHIAAEQVRWIWRGESRTIY